MRCHLEQIRRSDVQPLTSWCTYFGNIRYTSGGADCPAPDTSHLLSVLPFPPLPILRNVTLTSITTHFHCIPQWYVLSFTCIFSRCCLQYASQYFKQELFFKQLTGFYIFISRTKGTPLGSKHGKTHIHNNPEYEASAHFMHVRLLVTAFLCSVDRATRYNLCK